MDPHRRRRRHLRRIALRSLCAFALTAAIAYAAAMAVGGVTSFA